MYSFEVSANIMLTHCATLLLSRKLAIMVISQNLDVTLVYSAPISLEAHTDHSHHHQRQHNHPFQSNTLTMKHTMLPFERDFRTSRQILHLEAMTDH